MTNGHLLCFLSYFCSSLSLSVNRLTTIKPPTTKIVIVVSGDTANVLFWTSKSRSHKEFSEREQEPNRLEITSLSKTSVFHKYVWTSGILYTDCPTEQKNSICKTWIGRLRLKSGFLKTQFYLQFIYLFESLFITKYD